MKINKVFSTYKAPFVILIIDAFDAYYYADIMENGRHQKFAKVDTYELAVTLADANFIIKNFMWDDFKEMIYLDAGYDVRVYDANHSCVYAAHEKFKENWIEGAHALSYDFWHIE
jgi:hypothetical protein